ncbi:RraA family protein [Paraburkholderia madseniana]|uniref:Putative 4-hydroxy-4-methyl-2-oxoglutarate aldolase n=1 Tax=Paraburkholderia madseniana TaxID=2599607 RepID=A0A6N6WHQ9_9BURK|nr:RraA family protein [Paraburkholderia madseniana]KAE8760066.1 RraA family protein [Paraburkholderia madseniana]
MTSLADQLATCNTPGLFDVLRIHGLPVHELPRDIKGLAPTMKLAGPVFTVTGRADPTISVSESLELFISRVLSGAPRDHVVVCQPHDHARSAMGDLAAEALKQRGIRGYYIDGGSRDADEIEAIGFPVFARYTSPIDIVGSWRLEATDVPVVIGGVTVSAGDYLLGDRDGTLLIEREHAEFVITETVKTMSTDSRMRTAIRSGRDPYDAFLEFGKL